jgi:glycosyltransferase involved in cell wall biosynthesis
VVVHDYVTQRGGAERVVLQLLAAFPGSPLVTSCWNPPTTYPAFGNYHVETLWLDRVSPFRRDPRRAFPFLAAAFSRHAIVNADVVLCSSSGWAHRVATAAPKIVYCHNPARWLYQPRDYLPAMSGPVRRAVTAAMEPLRRSDRLAALQAARYVVNSSVVARRVKAAYGIDAAVVPPASGLAADGPQEPLPGIDPGFLLTVGRPRSYKRTELVADAVASLPAERLVIVGGSANRWPLPRITAVSGLRDAQMRWLYANAAGLVAVAEEDFGLSPVEAQSFGLPSVVLRSGGYLDSTIEDVTGVFVDEPSSGQVAEGIRSLRSRSWDPEAIRLSGKRFSGDAFAARMNEIVAQVLRRDRPAPASAAGWSRRGSRDEIAVSMLDDSTDRRRVEVSGSGQPGGRQPRPKAGVSDKTPQGARERINVSRRKK